MSVAEYRSEGGRFASGAHVLVLLEPGKGTGGLMWPAGYGNAVLKVEGEILWHPRQEPGYPHVYTLDEVQAAVSSTAAAPGTPTTGCGLSIGDGWLHARLAHFLADAQLVVAGTVIVQDGMRLTLQADQYLLGEGPAVLDLNVTAATRDPSTCTWQWAEFPEFYTQGDHVLLFLEPDDTGLAPWRPLARYHARFLVYDQFVADWPILTLRAVRDVLGVPLPPAPRPPLEQPAPGETNDSADDGDGLAWWLVGGAGALAVVVIAAAVLRRRRA